MAHPRNFADQDLRNRSFRNQDLQGADFSRSDLRGCAFNGANLQNASFERARLGKSHRDIVFLRTITVVVFLVTFAAVSSTMIADREGLLPMIAGSLISLFVVRQWEKQLEKQVREAKTLSESETFYGLCGGAANGGVYGAVSVQSVVLLIQDLMGSNLDIFIAVLLLVMSVLCAAHIAPCVKIALKSLQAATGTSALPQ